MPARITGLTALARMYDIQPAYVNIAGERRTASPDALLQTLRSLGAAAVIDRSRLGEGRFR